MKPIRLQLSRRKGFELQALSRATNGLAAVNVARPARWSNPWRIGAPLDWLIPEGGKGPLEKAAPGAIVTREIAIEQFRRWVSGSAIQDIQTDLRGKNLACWCKPGEPCHADVLLELANE